MAIDIIAGGGIFSQYKYPVDLDPALAWVGVKNSGRGCTLSKFGFDYLTR